MTPPARLFSGYRRDLTSVLVVGGSVDERVQVAYTFHCDSVLRSGPFVCVDGAFEQSRLRAALENWISPRERQPWGDPLRSSQHGTVFIDSIVSLPHDLQRLLLGFVMQFVNVPHERREDTWVGRVAIGNAQDPLIAVSEGRFSALLHDWMDKVRVELPRNQRRYET